MEMSLSSATGGGKQSGGTSVTDVNTAVQMEEEVSGPTEDSSATPNCLGRCESKVSEFIKGHRRSLTIGRNIILLLGFIVYFGFAIEHGIGDGFSENFWRLIWCTILGILLLTWHLLQRRKRFRAKTESVVHAIGTFYNRGKKATILRWILLIAMALFMVIYVVVTVALRQPENLRSLIGIFVFLLLLFIYSNNKTKVNWYTVFWGIALQFIMALIILKTKWGASIIRWMGDRLSEFVANADAGSVFIFGPTFRDHPIAFLVLPRIMFLLVAISVISYLGVIQFLVETFGRALAFALHTAPVEGIFMVGTIFLNVPECMILVQEYLPTMKPSELFIVSAGTLATVGGTSIVLFMGLGIPAAPLIAASAMSAPAGIMAGKLAFPSFAGEKSPDERKTDQRAELRLPNSLMEAAMFGLRQAVPILVQALAMILTFIGIVEFISNTFVWFGDRIGVDDMSLEFLLSYIFYPLAFVMGARHEDCLKIGELLGIRSISLAAVSFPRLGPVIRNGAIYRAYISNPNNTWTEIGGNIFIEATNTTLIGGVIEPRSEAIVTYAMCGSASVIILGFVIAVYETLVPERHTEVMGHTLRALVAGTLASYMTACFAGLLFDEDIGYT